MKRQTFIVAIILHIYDPLPLPPPLVHIYMLGLPEYPYSVLYRYYVLSYTVTQSITSSHYEQTAMI